MPSRTPQPPVNSPATKAEEQKRLEQDLAYEALKSSGELQRREERRALELQIQHQQGMT